MSKLILTRQGSCKRCGKCCDKSLSQPYYWDEMERTSDPDVRVAETTDDDRLLVPRLCGSLRFDEDGVASCAIWKDRPEICREFPQHPRDIALIPECGYWFKAEWRDED